MRTIVTVLSKIGRRYYTQVHVFACYPSRRVIKALATDEYVVQVSATNTRGEVVFTASRKFLREHDNDEVSL
jgi:hypothetical protein